MHFLIYGGVPLVAGADDEGITSALPNLLDSSVLAADEQHRVTVPPVSLSLMLVAAAAVAIGSVRYVAD